MARRRRRLRRREVITVGPDGHYVTRGSVRNLEVLAGPFDSRSDAQAWMRANEANENPSGLAKLGWTIGLTALTAAVSAVTIYYVNRKLTERETKTETVTVNAGVKGLPQRG